MNDSPGVPVRILPLKTIEFKQLRKNTLKELYRLSHHGPDIGKISIL